MSGIVTGPAQPKNAYAYAGGSHGCICSMHRIPCQYFFGHAGAVCFRPLFSLLCRTFRFFKGLRFLVKACYCFLPSLFWAMVLLAVFISIGALVQGSLLQDFILDETADLEHRQWVWSRYGTAYRSLYTYEITFVPCPWLMGTQS